MAEFSSLRSLLVSLPAFQKPRDDYSAAGGKLADEILRDHERAEGDYLEGLIDPSTRAFDMVAENRFIFLTPYQAHNNTYLPLLAATADYDRERPKVNVLVLLYARYEEKNEIRCLSYRFDVPNRTIGEHDFFHMQFAWGAKDDRRHRHAERWISRKDPSIPLDATTPIEMFLSAILSFRNSHTEMRGILDQWIQAGIPMKPLVENMAMNRWKGPWIIAPGSEAASHN